MLEMHREAAKEQTKTKQVNEETFSDSEFITLEKFAKTSSLLQPGCLVISMTVSWRLLNLSMTLPRRL